MHLSFQLVERNSIQIFADEDGLGALETAIKQVRENGGHLHLKAPKNLSAKTPWLEDAIAEVILTTGGD